ncbi:tetratricopeptide repeat protein [Ligilactobacillus agilis]|uniref:Tetratricopeptide repeat protein n=1 Tax=Ligilactobacillus agilis TaxID=1601 RepID=A0A2I2ABD2_9LACO|nr:tetratricopeptide repeat protein [Ligilactobacillus agilis]MBM6763401.1 tetratricopeptide repeat protein [Ligilactobacillus agilis]MBM6773113.1 tetratricopeptide repeat protein [Ligilactobacillus agilis]MDO4455968.1 tetratricopeptide repeat protein [Ligilactobacillus agilis]MDO4597082.1 tetratricopeptide repeat protein [Ligilactobacillus agilis]MDY4065371.1 tetratricopeptide repeat protein [Ligilactobacillus agilis]
MTKREEKEKQAQVALKQLIAQVDKDPYNPEAYYQLGMALTEMKSYPQAEELFKKALNVFEGQADKQALLHYGLGNVFYASEFYPEALKEFQAVKDSKLANEALLMLAQTNYAQKQYQSCVAFALTVFEQDATNTTALKLVADSLMALGSFAEAKQYYQKFLELSPANVEVLFSLGLVKLVLGEDAKGLFTKVKQSDAKYYAKMQTRLQEVEAFIKKTQPKDKAGD